MLSTFGWFDASLQPSWTAPPWISRTALAAVFAGTTVANAKRLMERGNAAKPGESYPAWRCPTRWIDPGNYNHLNGSALSLAHP
jgi:hypothetical protein